MVGAGSYATSLSGSTIDCPGELFPMKNVPVLKLTPEEQESAFRGEAAPLAERVRWFLSQSDSPRLVIAMDGEANPSYPRIKALAAALAGAAEAALPPEEPLLAVIREDMAKALGQSVRPLLPPGRPAAFLDSIQAEQNDYMDMGRPLMDGLVVPVVVKTLIFG